MIKFINKNPINYERVSELLKNSETIGQMTNDGPVKRLLDKTLKSLLSLPDEKKVLSLSNGTSALHLIIRFLDLKYQRKLKWASTDFTFPSVMQADREIRIFDISIDDGAPIELDWESFDVIVITNLFGSYVNIESFRDECKSRGKILVFDNASSPLSLINNENKKNICDFEISFGSLHHTKIIGFGEGGFIVCNQEDYESMNRLSNFGFDIERNWSILGNNYKISDVSAAFVIQNIEQFSLPEYTKFQNNIISIINGLDNCKLFNYKPGTVYGNLPIVFDSPTSHLKLRDLGIEANKYYKPLFGLPNSKWLYDRIVNLPMSQNFGDYELEKMEYILKKVKNK
jgi:dTDP-4-amino-4,6-dideoxygalactose transaminase